MTAAAAMKEAQPPMEPAAQYDAVVVGLGRTGFACLRYLHGLGLTVAAVDTRSDPPMATRARLELPDVPVRTGELDEAWLRRARQLVVSPGVSIHEPVIERVRESGAEVIGDVELFARASEAPVIAVTGSNGKSTVTRLVEHMGRETGVDVIAAGNIGTPVLELLDGPGHACYAMELSSFQLETTESLRPAAAVVLNVSHDHMDRYAGFEDYVDAKQRVYRGAAAAVFNRDDPQTRPRQAPATVYTFGLDRPGGERDFGIIEADGDTWLAVDDQRLLPTTALRLDGRHNWANVLAALALGRAAGWDVAACAAAAAGFQGLPHRMELVAVRDGVRWINDSKATNVGATIAALAGASAPVVLIAGGDGKGADFRPLRDPVREHARAVILIGRDAPRIEAAISGAVPTLEATDLRAAVNEAAGMAQPGDTVLLAPACASFDMFRDYEHRGETFRAAVEALS